MNKRPGHVTVTTEVGYCNFCDRTRNLRREDRQLGALVRTVVTCESCHRTLSSSMGVASSEPETPAAVPEVVPSETPSAAPAEPAPPKAKAAATKATSKPKARPARAAAKPAPKRPAKSSR